MSDIKDSKLINELNTKDEFICKDPDILFILEESKKVQKFIDRIATLTFGRNFIVIKPALNINLTPILNLTV